MSQKYFMLSYNDTVKHACLVTRFNKDVAVDLASGKSMQNAWPADVSFPMDPEHPTDTVLVDYVSNYESVLLASPKLRDFFRAQNLPGVEFLKVAILDHKGKVVSDDYSVIHCTRVVDCVDQEQSKFRWVGDDPQTMNVRKLVLKEEALGADDKMIQPKYVWSTVLLREDLAKALSDQGFPTVAFTREKFGDGKVYDKL